MPPWDKNPHPTYCHCRNPWSITITIDLLPKQIQVSKSEKTNPSRQIQVENTNSVTIKVLWQIQVANNNYKKKVNKKKWVEKEKRKWKMKLNKWKRKIKK